MTPEEIARLHALPNDALVTPVEAAEVLRLKLNTLNFYRCNRPGYGPHFVRVGGRIRYAMGELREYRVAAGDAAGAPPQGHRRTGGSAPQGAGTWMRKREAPAMGVHRGGRGEVQQRTAGMMSRPGAARTPSFSDVEALARARSELHPAAPA